MPINADGKKCRCQKIQRLQKWRQQVQYQASSCRLLADYRIRRHVCRCSSCSASVSVLQKSRHRVLDTTRTSFFVSYLISVFFYYMMSNSEFVNLFFICMCVDYGSAFSFAFDGSSYEICCLIGASMDD